LKFKNTHTSIIALEDNQLYFCKVCGFNDYPNQFWEKSKDVGYQALFFICPCCGCESGLDDFTLAGIYNYRKEWISDEMKWFSPKEKPNNWNFEEQKENIPIPFRDLNFND